MSPSNTIWPGPRSTFVPSGVFIFQRFGHNRHEPKTGGYAPFMGVGGGGLPKNDAESALHAPACAHFYHPKFRQHADWTSHRLVNSRMTLAAAVLVVITLIYGHRTLHRSHHVLAAINMLG